MPIQQDSPAVALARSHAEAWSHHDWDTARKMLAPDVHITAASTHPAIPPTDLTGSDAYMEGLLQFAQPIEPGSLGTLVGVGDERNSLLLVTVRAVGQGGEPMTISAARLALFDEHQQLKEEQVVFFAVPA